MANDSARQSKPAVLERQIGHAFRDQSLLRKALTHGSLAYEQAVDDTPDPALADNEQLEFLGDAVVGLLAAESLYRRYPELDEGDLTRLRAALVSRQHLAEVALKFDLGAFLFIGKGEERSGGRKKTALLANALEALIAAIYLDPAPSSDFTKGACFGLEAARVFVEQWVVEPYVNQLHAALAEGGSIGDHKSALQEYLQARKAGQPLYAVKGESGPDHRKRFLVEVRATLDKEGHETQEERVLANGSGNSKKHAEQEAARRAYRKLLREGRDSRPAGAAAPPELVS